ncbi:hypothetical protein EJB05_45708, partial [Eragrostis curvula]
MDTVNHSTGTEQARMFLKTTWITGYSKTQGTCNLSSSSLGSSIPLPLLLNDAELNTLALGQAQPRLATLADGEHITQTGGELVAQSVLNVDGLKGSLMLLPVLDHTNTASVSSTSHHDDVADIELDEVNNLVGLQINLDGVVGLDERVRVADGATIIGVQVRDALLAKLDRPNLAQLPLHIEHEQ